MKDQYSYARTLRQITNEFKDMQEKLQAHVNFSGITFRQSLDALVKQGEQLGFEDLEESADRSSEGYTLLGGSLLQAGLELLRIAIGRVESAYDPQEPGYDECRKSVRYARGVLKKFEGSA